ncbi:hypothetical protein ACFPOU_12955 [Massilia jejuensis]|uniref:Uncharacterized protein n=1 Tax=Massilia jejuensis TaxID=648894 RepID=A0ABW0PJ39_9BURK
MRPWSFTLALAGLLLSSAAPAAEPSFCSSVCDSERRACKVNVQQLAAEDGDGLVKLAERHRNAMTPAKLPAPSAAAIAGERSSIQARRIQRTADCDVTYGRCTRTCKAAAAAAPAPTPRKSG